MMFDPDAGHAHTLRLDPPLHEAVPPEQAVADAEREMTEATMRWIDARMRLEALQAQSRPIPVSDSVSGNFTAPVSAMGLGGGRLSDAVAGVVTAVHRDGATVTVRLGDVAPEIAKAVTDNDFWTNKHRVMAGNEAKIARANGQIEYLHEDDGA